jgi:Haem-binding domain/Cytochrome P460
VSFRSRTARWLVWICGCGMVAFGAIQFIRPSISHPPVTADLAAPAEVKEILRTSCYDCHSNETRLAWFDQVAPAYWIVASDVKNGRSHLNFSDIGQLPPAQQKGALYEAVSEIQLGAMPLPAYTRLHRGAIVTPAQLAVLKAYLNPPAPEAAASASALAADDAQYRQWIGGGNPPQRVSPAPNGIEFPSDYKNWKMVSASDRFDNQSLRMILGNDVAIKAIAEDRMNPWPDGTTFAKVAWFARDDGQGQVRAGAFWQVEFMIRDSRKYSATKGWGWARWRGTEFTPYGKEAGFSAECVGCHTPLRDNDYVFTMPLRDQASHATTALTNDPASLRGSLPDDPLRWRVIVSLADRHSSTMSVLYGNDAAVEYARSHSEQNYPPGSVLALATWKEQEDARWFGARIPSQVKSVEFVRVSPGADNRPSYAYEIYQGAPLARTPASNDGSADERTSFLLSLHAAVMP